MNLLNFKLKKCNFLEKDVSKPLSRKQKQRAKKRLQKKQQNDQSVIQKKTSKKEKNSLVKKCLEEGKVKVLAVKDEKFKKKLKNEDKSSSESEEDREEMSIVEDEVRYSKIFLINKM